MSYASKLVTGDGTKPIGSNLFGTCATASATSVKVVTMSDFNVLTEGVTIHVHFTHANEDAATLKVGSTAAKSINGGAKWADDSVVSFTYHNGAWYQNDYQEGSGGSTYTETPNAYGTTVSII